MCIQSNLARKLPRHCLVGPMNNRFRVFAFLSFAVVAASSQASFTMIERTTAMNALWQYGSGFEIYPGSADLSSTSINGEFFNRLNATESRSGWTEFAPWEAGISYDLVQEWGMTSNGFTGSGSTSVQSMVLGDAFSIIESRTNQLILHFSNNTATDYIFEGASTWQGTVHLEKLQPFGWENVYTNPEMGGFMKAGFMDIGQYRIVANGEAFADGNMMSGASYSFQLSAVPEPGTMAIMGIGVAAILRRRRGNRS